MFYENAQMGRRRRRDGRSERTERSHWMIREMLFGDESGPRRGRGGRSRGGPPPDGFGGGPFGGRRPLRFLARKLGLSREQVADLSAVLSTLRTERAQMSVDTRRASAAIADVMAAEVFDEAKASAAQADLATARKRLDGHIASALQRTHAILEPEQRRSLAAMIREMPAWFV